MLLQLMHPRTTFISVTNLSVLFVIQTYNKSRPDVHRLRTSIITAVDYLWSITDPTRLLFPAVVSIRYSLALNPLRMTFTADDEMWRTNCSGKIAEKFSRNPLTIIFSQSRTVRRCNNFFSSENDRKILR